ncbi:MAG: hypothetical protein IKZ26_05660 [Peptococcaceae bacterium]|nr:hypothetical protein [Peptococcaceae bacterium]
MSNAFEKAERSCFNLTHYAKMFPESHALFVMPPGCSRILRLSSIEEGISHRFTMFNLEQSDVINGSVESIVIDGAARTIKRLTELGRRPKIFSVFVSCVDSFIGTDRDYIMEELRQMEPDMIFFDLAVDPINRDTMAPLVRVHNTVTALFEKTGQTRTVNWIGNYLRPEDTHPLVQKLQENGLESRHLSDCSTVDELRLMGNSTANIAMTAMGLPAVKKLKERFGTPYYNLMNPNDPDSLTEEALLAL